MEYITESHNERGAVNPRFRRDSAVTALTTLTVLGIGTALASIVYMTLSPHLLDAEVRQEATTHVEAPEPDKGKAAYEEHDEIKLEVHSVAEGRLDVTLYNNTESSPVIVDESDFLIYLKGGGVASVLGVENGFPTIPPSEHHSATLIFNPTYDGVISAVSVRAVPEVWTTTSVE